MEPSEGAERQTEEASAQGSLDLAQALVSLSLERPPKRDDLGDEPERDQTDAYEAGTSTPSHAQPYHEVPDSQVLKTPPNQTIAQTRELLDSVKLASASTSKTLVIYHQDCEKHKYGRSSRPREIATIVERPERLRAARNGIAAAKYRLQVEGLPGFDERWSTRSGAILDPAVLEVHGKEFPQRLQDLCEQSVQKLLMGQVEVPDDYHAGDLYLGKESIDAIGACIGALYDGVDAVFLTHDRVHLSIRPPGHHCAKQLPSGFCWLNNVQIAIAYARQKYGVQRAAILDFDLHHGDGSQDIAWAQNEARPDSVGYFSLHDINSFPCEWGQVDKVKEASLCMMAHGQAIWNIHLDPYSSEAEFDQIYQSKYSILLEKARDYLRRGAARGEKGIVILSAGFDACEHEGSGMQRHKVAVPVSFYERFTRDAVRIANESTNAKLLSVMEGGYSDRAITSGSFSHLTGLALPTDTLETHAHWWSVPHLVSIERAVLGKKPVSKPTKIQPFVLTEDRDVKWASLVQANLAPPVPSIIPETPDTERRALRERKPVPYHLAGEAKARRTPKSAPVKPRHHIVPNHGPIDFESKLAEAQQQTVGTQNSAPGPPIVAASVLSEGQPIASDSVRSEGQSSHQRMDRADKDIARDLENINLSESNDNSAIDAAAASMTVLKDAIWDPEKFHDDRVAQVKREGTTPHQGPSGPMLEALRKMESEYPGS